MPFRIIPIPSALSAVVALPGCVKCSEREDTNDMPQGELEE
jgi:hypothetical protein